MVGNKTVAWKINLQEKYKMNVILNYSVAVSAAFRKLHSTSFQKGNTFSGILMGRTGNILFNIFACIHFVIFTFFRNMNIETMFMCLQIPTIL